MTKSKPCTPFRSLFFELSSRAGFDLLSDTKPFFLQKHRGPEQVDKQQGPEVCLQGAANPKLS